MRNITKALGQHMLVDRQALAKIIESSQLNKNDTVLEAGTGTGILTQELCKLAKNVISYELDERLYAQAKDQLQFSNLELVRGDLFKKTNMRFDVLVSNLPYSRSRDALEWLAIQQFRKAIVMVQEEFANKLLAKPGDRNYRAISALAGYCFTIKKLFNVGRHSFNPKPKVQSTVIQIDQVNITNRGTIKGLNLLFSKRNKRASAVAAELGIMLDAGTKRVYQLEPSSLIKMAELM